MGQSGCGSQTGTISLSPTLSLSVNTSSLDCIVYSRVVTLLVIFHSDIGVKTYILGA